MANRFFSALALHIGNVVSKSAHLNNISDATETAFDMIEGEVDNLSTSSTSAATHIAGDGSDHSEVAANSLVRHNEIHTVVSHSDTTTTGAELDELSGGGRTNLHSHNELKSDTGVSLIVVDSGMGNVQIGGGGYSVSIVGNSNMEANNVHRASSGTDHADVVTNSTHRAGNGSDHADVAANTTHRTGSGADHSEVAANSAARHTEAHTVASHSDTTMTGSQANELVDGTPNDLHSHWRLVSDTGNTGVAVHSTGWKVDIGGGGFITHITGTLTIHDFTTFEDNINCNGNMKMYGYLSLRHAPPATQTTSCVRGDMCIDADYLYIGTAPNHWKRIALDDTAW